MKSDYVFGQFKVRYCVRGYFWEWFSPEPLNVYFLVFKWTVVMLMLILKCIIYFLDQGFISFTNDFSQECIPWGGGIFNEFPRGVNINWGQSNFVMNWIKPIWSSWSRKILELKFFNGWLDHGLVVSNFYPWLFMYKTVFFCICLWLFILGMFTIWY